MSISYTWAVTRRLAAGALLVVGFVVSFIAAPSPASACSCLALTDEEAFGYADVVFVGQRTELIGARSRDPRWVFEVDRVYKGDARARQSVASSGGTGMCGLADTFGNGPLLMFARSESEFSTPGVRGEIYSGLCSGNRVLGEAVPASFGVGYEPTPGASGIGPSNHSPTRLAPVMLGGAVVAVAAAGGVVAARRLGRA